MLVFRLATRNLFRQLARNTLSMVSIVMGVFVIVVGRGFQNGLNENMIRGEIDSRSAHVTAVPADYPTAGFRHPVEDAWAIPDDARGWLDAHTTAWTPRLIATPRAIKGRESMRVRMVGLGPGDEAVFPRDTWEISGAAPEADQVLVAATPARLLGVAAGDILTLETRTVDGAMNAMRFTVSGTVRTGNPLIDNVALFLPLSSADTLLNAKGRVTHLSALLASREASEAFAPELASHLPGTEVRTWQEEVAPIIEAQAIRQTMFDIMGLALLLMAATGIANTVLMAAYERTREIGTLRSMGLQRGGVLGMFALEGFWMGLIGGLVGMVGGGILTGYYSTHGIDLTALMSGKQDAMDNVPMAAMLYLEFSWPTLFVAWAVGIVVAVLASLYPAVAASRISPAEAVRAL